MLSCDDALELISAKLDGPLSEEEAARLEEHLSACPACRALADDLGTLHMELPGLAAQPPAGLKQGVMERIRAAKVTPFQGQRRQWRWRSLAFLAAVLAIVVIGAGTMGQWRSDGFRGTDSSLASEPAAGGSEADSSGIEIAPAATGPAQTESGTAAAGADDARPESQDSVQTGSQDSRSIPAAVPEEPAASAVQPQSGGSGAGLDKDSQAAGISVFTAGSGLTREEALYQLAAWLGWSTDGLTVGEDGTITGPDTGDGTTTRLMCAGLNEAGTGWICQLEEVTPGPEGTASCTSYTVALDGSGITQP